MWFSLSGHKTVKAKTSEGAWDKVDDMSAKELLPHVDLDIINSRGPVERIKV